MTNSFTSSYTHGFIRAAVCIPRVRVADPAYNVERTLELARRASALHAAVALFPELGISAYSNDDLFHQDALLEATEAALKWLVERSCDLTPVLLVGAALRFEGKLFNCAVALYRGRVLGIIPQDVFTKLSRILRKTPIHFRSRGGGKRSYIPGSTNTFR